MPTSETQTATLKQVGSRGNVAALTVKTGPGTESYTGLYAPLPQEKTLDQLYKW